MKFLSIDNTKKLLYDLVEEIKFSAESSYPLEEGCGIDIDSYNDGFKDGNTYFGEYFRSLIEAMCLNIEGYGDFEEVR